MAVFRTQVAATDVMLDSTVLFHKWTFTRCTVLCPLQEKVDESVLVQKIDKSVRCGNPKGKTRKLVAVYKILPFDSAHSALKQA